MYANIAHKRLLRPTRRDAIGRGVRLQPTAARAEGTEDQQYLHHQPLRRAAGSDGLPAGGTVTATPAPAARRRAVSTKVAADAPHLHRAGEINRERHGVTGSALQARCRQSIDRLRHGEEYTASGGTEGTFSGTVATRRAFTLQGVGQG